MIKKIVLGRPVRPNRYDKANLDCIYFRQNLYQKIVFQISDTKGQMKSECIYEIIDFPKYQ